MELILCLLYTEWFLDIVFLETLWDITAVLKPHRPVASHSSMTSTSLFTWVGALSTLSLVCRGILQRNSTFKRFKEGIEGDEGKVMFKSSAKLKAQLDFPSSSWYCIDLRSWAKTTIFPGSSAQICRQILNGSNSSRRAYSQLEREVSNKSPVSCCQIAQSSFRKTWTRKGCYWSPWDFWIDGFCSNVL